MPWHDWRRPAGGAPAAGSSEAQDADAQAAASAPPLKAGRCVKPLMSVRFRVIESLLPNRVRVLSNLEERR